MRKIILLGRKITSRSFTPRLVLTLASVALSIAPVPSAQAQKYSHWPTPVNLGAVINSTASDQGPAISKGGVDLWVAYRQHTHDDFDWQTPVNLGAGVNSSAGDNAPSYLENDELGVVQLYFVSSRAGGLGGQDIYLSDQMPDGSFGSASLVSDLSTPSTDSRPSIRHDGLEIFFQSNRPGSLSAALDLWVATRASTLDGWSSLENLGSAINTTSIDNNANLSSDGKTLFFSSDRPGGFGGLDLYITTRTKLRGQSGKLLNRQFRFAEPRFAVGSKKRLNY